MKLTFITTSSPSLSSGAGVPGVTSLFFSRSSLSSSTESFRLFGGLGAWHKWSTIDAACAQNSSLTNNVSQIQTYLRLVKVSKGE